MGWMSNWQYANRVPTRKWRSAMTLPRELKLIPHQSSYLLSSAPVEELKILREEKIQLEAGGDKMYDIGPELEGKAPLFEMDLVFSYEPGEAPTPASAVEFGINLSSHSKELFVIGFNTYSKNVFFGRKEISGKVDFSEHFTGMHKAPYHISENGEIRFQVHIDLSSVELFVDDGAVVLTDIVFPEAGYQILSWYRSDTTVNLKKGDIYRLRNIW
jgi:sucrose-6-phosphate hydrolase SacC (GH32 family)